MTLAAAPILNYGPNAYIPGWEKPATLPVGRDESADERSRIVNEILFPILNSEDITLAFPEKWTSFKEWRDAAIGAVAADTFDLDALLRREDAIEEQLRRIFAESSERLGEKWAKVLTSGLMFRKIVRESVLPHVSIWPEDSRNTIACRMALNELCLVCILHHLESGEGREDNVQMLAYWSYKYGDYAALEASFGSAKLDLGRKLERAE